MDQVTSGDKWLRTLLRIIAEIVVIILRAVTQVIIDIVRIIIGVLERFTKDVWISILLVIITVIKGILRIIWDVVCRLYKAISPPVYEIVSVRLQRHPRAVASCILVLTILLLCSIIICFSTLLLEF